MTRLDPLSWAETVVGSADWPTFTHGERAMLLAAFGGSINHEQLSVVRALVYLGREDVLLSPEAGLGQHNEGGLPVHLPMGFNAEGQGPEDDEAAIFYGCWCGNPECSLSRALRRAGEAGERRAKDE